MEPITVKSGQKEPLILKQRVQHLLEVSSSTCTSFGLHEQCMFEVL